MCRLSSRPIIIPYEPLLEADAVGLSARSHLIVHNEAFTGMQRCHFLSVGNGSEEVTVSFRAAILSVMRQGQA